MNFRTDINGLRAWAVVIVVLYHFGVVFFDGGFAGVDVFFVISGFLMTGIITGILESKSDKTLRGQIFDFYLARIRRILPALISVCGALLLLGWFFFSPNNFESLARQSLSALLFYSNILFFNQAGYFDVASSEKLLLHTWSLSIEWQFYILLPVLMLGAWKIKSSKEFLFGVLGVAFFVSLTYSIVESLRSPDAAFYLLTSRAWELLIGGLVFFVSSKFSIGAKSGKLIERVSFVVLIITVLFFDSSLSWPGYYAIVPTFATAFIILVKQKNSKWTSSNVAQWLGSRSYSLYLWHWPISIFVKGLDSQYLYIYTVGGILATLVAGHLSYEFIENNSRKYFFRDWTLKNISISAFSVFSIVGASAVVAVNSGYPSRFSTGVEELSKYRFDLADYRDGTCFLRPEQTYNDFKDCTARSVSANHTSALLWGDSHAAHLYPGLIKTLPRDVEFTQFNASACPPFLDLDVPARPNCKKINDYVREWIVKNKPDQVILSAKWPGYDWSPIANTIAFLKSNGVKKIQVFGPVPQWNERLSDLLITKVNKDEAAGAQVPNRLSSGFIPLVGYIDEKMHAITDASNVIFISPYNILCNAEGCMTTISDSHGLSPTAMDDSHLSVSASEYLVSKSKVWQK
jgi:peptidoglycan/LPS O-acetylase OafA/YrhL